MSNTIITNCVCENKYQDSQYGKGIRVHNVSGKEEDKHTCTLCGRVYKGKICINYEFIKKPFSTIRLEKGFNV